MKYFILILAATATLFLASCDHKATQPAVRANSFSIRGGQMPFNTDRAQSLDTNIVCSRVYQCVLSDGSLALAVFVAPASCPQELDEKIFNFLASGTSSCDPYSAITGYHLVFHEKPLAALVSIPVYYTIEYNN